MAEPTFRYHPDPLASGAALRTDHVCSVCGMDRQLRYQGPIYGRQPDSLCLHCINSGEVTCPERSRGRRRGLRHGCGVQRCR
ncbi:MULTISPECIES: CbrC family protein [unclassified Streptomyces]|uniref:CbrC family protein n=1 Tax=unclassified Streptomyces TaxID=2593676 RepID=UPI0036ACCC56